jgi:hypothetical protein
MLPEKLVGLDEQLGRGDKRLNLQQLQSLLLSLCGSFNRIFILIGALDECNITKERALFLSMIQPLQDASVKTFITSRPNLENIKTQLDQFPQVEIVATESDIRRYLEERVKTNPVFMKRITSSLGLEEKFVNTIASRASGM